MTPDEQIDRFIAHMFGNSEPGAVMHQLLLASTDLADGAGAELPDPDTWQVSIAAIAPGSLQETGMHPDGFVHMAVVQSILDKRQAGRVIQFALLAMEMTAVPDDGDEVTENLCRRLHADGTLEKHPKAVEVTRLYGACRDGRRWTGEHYLTGARAGEIVGPKVHVGAIGRRERGQIERALRVAVGITTRMTGPEKGAARERT